MEAIHILCYFGKGGYAVDPFSLTTQETEWLIDRLEKQYDHDNKELEKALKK